MPPDNQTNSGLAMLASLTAKTGGGLGGVAGDLLGMKSSGALFVGVLRSRTVEDRISGRFQLKKVYGIKLEQDVRNELSENTAISEDRKSGILTIAVTDRDPRRAAGMATAYVDELNQLVAELSTSSAHRERVFLEERLRAVKQDLDEASRQFSQFASKNNTIDIKEQGRAMVQGASTVEGELIASKSELKGLEEIYADNNVRVRSLRARITELKRQLEMLGGTGAGDSGRATESSGYPSISRLPLLGVAYADLYRRMQIQEAVYETLTQQYELAKVQEAKETPSVKVLDAASLPERKSYPPRTLVAVLVTLLVSGGAVMLVVARSAWDQTDANDPGKLLAQEFFQTANASMPWAEPGGWRAQAVAHRVWVRLVRRGNLEKSSRSPAN
jgi:capsule polysaccharide export protein KpsE/RkpR